MSIPPFLRTDGKPGARLSPRPADDVAAAPRRRRLGWPQASLSTYLFGMILAAVVPLALLMAWQGVSQADDHRAALLDHLGRAAGVVAFGVERELDASAGTLHALAQSDSLQRGDPATFRERLSRRAALSPAWDCVVLARRDGGIVFDLGPDGRPAMPAPPPDLAKVFPALKGDTLRPALVSDLVEASMDGSGATWVAVPGVSSAGVGYWLAARIPATVWQADLESVGLGPGGFVAVFDARGHRIAANPRAAARTDAPGMPAASGVHRTDVAGQGAAYAAWQRLPDSAWRVEVGTAAAPLDAARDRAVGFTLASTVACLLVGAAAAHLLASRIVRPLQALVRDRQGLAVPIAVSEIDTLRVALLQAENDRREAVGRLLKKADEFETLFHTSPIGLAFAQDAGCLHVLCNDHLRTLLPPGGEAPAAWPGSATEVLLDGAPLPPAERPLAKAARSGAAAGPLELEIRGASGASRHVLESAAPLADEFGRPRGAIGVTIDVTATRLAERERSASLRREQAARREAEQANQAKDEFLSMLGHELRNPLNAIVTSVEVLRRAPADPVASSARTVLARQTHRLIEMMDRLIDVGRVIADEVVLLRQPLDLASLARSRAAAAQPRALGREQRLQVRADDRVWVCGDAERLAQVIDHLVDNALKYAPPASVVDLAVAADGADAVVTVRDEGPGMDPELIGRMFGPFVQGPREPDRQAGGFGIGLTLVKRLVELHGGQVRAASSAGGTLFEVRLVRTEAPQALAAAEPADRRYA